MNVINSKQGKSWRLKAESETEKRLDGIVEKNYKTIQRALGAYIGGVHLFPFRTEKLSPPEPMVLQ